ncbi:hypothetical protein ACIRF8_18155 [Streptomyces sp. NPDC102406]|uniref:hypothetical protein n=1 Tax=Streptomyces sp. NPDC102406 TaxID=3366171 RepID=UPI00382E944B
MAHQEAQVRTAADIAISRAWRRSEREPDSTGERDTCAQRVLVAEVVSVSREHFGIEVEPHEAAAVLRQRFMLRAGALGLTTDAFDEDRSAQ